MLDVMAARLLEAVSDGTCPQRIGEDDGWTGGCTTADGVRVGGSLDFHGAHNLQVRGMWEGQPFDFVLDSPVRYDYTTDQGGYSSSIAREFWLRVKGGEALHGHKTGEWTGVETIWSRENENGRRGGVGACLEVVSAADGVTGIASADTFYRGDSYRPNEGSLLLEGDGTACVIWYDGVATVTLGEGAAAACE